MYYKGCNSILNNDVKIYAVIIRYMRLYKEYANGYNL